MDARENGSHQYIFLMGVPRSGTTWLRNMIAHHPAVLFKGGSMTLFSRYVMRLEREWKGENQNFKNKGWSRGLPNFLSQDDFDNLVGTFVRRAYGLILENGGHTHYIEKATDSMPVAKSIKKHIPDARVVNVIRDGRNVAISRHSMWRRFGSPFGVRSIEEGAQTWRDGIFQARSFAEDFSDDYLEVRYERLLKDRQVELKRIFEFCGLPARAELLNEIEQAYDFSNVQVGKPTPDIQRKASGDHEGWREKMSYVDRYRFHLIAGGLLQELGYASEGWWYDSPVHRYSGPALHAARRGSEVLLDLSMRKIGRKVLSRISRR